MKEQSGKVIKQPGERANEYGKYAFYGYYGCPNGCDYCYLKKGRFAKVLGIDHAKLKADFKSDDDVLEALKLDITKFESELQQHGLFFVFNSDPLLPETNMLTVHAVNECQKHNIPVKILSKRVDTFPVFNEYANHFGWNKKIIALGQTLTGCDEREPFASPNQARCNGIYNFKFNGYRTFASIEPIIDFGKSKYMIAETALHCDHYKIGLEKGRDYRKSDVLEFVEWVNKFIEAGRREMGLRTTIYWKDSILKKCDIPRRTLPGYCVQRDFNLFL